MSDLKSDRRKEFEQAPNIERGKGRLVYDKQRWTIVAIASEASAREAGCTQSQSPSHPIPHKET